MTETPPRAEGPPPRGVRQPNGHLKVAVSFPDFVFDKIKKMAIAENKSFSAMVTELCKVGIFDLEESDRLEPPRGSQQETPHA